ncbi:MAG: SEC-C domain-containing protein [Planctomycetes bacterium]|nr:SEC-C domain-containing protein [Planctomycetota bacterium]
MLSRDKILSPPVSRLAAACDFPASSTQKFLPYYSCGKDRFIDSIIKNVENRLRHKNPLSGKMTMERGNMAIPDANDLAGWKAADLQLARKFSHQMENNVFRSAKVLKRYFGGEDARAIMIANEQRAVFQAYTTWAVLDYRQNKTSKTLAEIMLEKGLPEPEAMLLRARMESYPSLYRVAGHDAKAGTAVFEDVLLGGAVTIYDKLFSENIDNGVFIVARVFPAGKFHIFDPAGPPLGAMMGDEAAEFLQDCGLEFTKEGLRRDPHLFGLLWSWVDQWEKNWKPPRLCNTDGDDLLWHTASFSVADVQKVHGALAGRKDIEYDETEDEYIWVRDAKGSSRVIGDTLHLGRIELLADELILSVNSAKRFTAGRKWLEKLPGVVFNNVTTRRIDESEKDRPLDERISKPQPVKMTPELMASLQEMFNKQYMKWLDTPLPVLKGKTPREACQTPVGRQQVAILIRTMPDSAGDVPIPVPRQAMLRELGLDKETSPEPTAGHQKSPASESKPTASSQGKIGRNDPCPCGSGKKYKKCCGQ